MKYRIGSFNMYKFQAYRSDDDIRKDLSKIAEIIRSEKFDVIGLQEVFSENAMNLLLSHLGNSWTGAWACPNSRSMHAAEGYAFIWNKNRIKLSESVTASGRRIYHPRIYNQYKIDRKKNQTTLIRNPYYARFTPVNRFLEIRLINVHVTFSNSNDDDILSRLSNAEVRKNEYDIIVNSIFGKESDKRYGNNMPAYTFILGDYNLNLNRTWNNYPYLSEIIMINDGTFEKIVRASQDKPTTLVSSQKIKERRYANNYDHFSYDENRFCGIALTADRVDTLNKYYGGNVELHRKEVSDHVPIIMEVDL